MAFSEVIQTTLSLLSLAALMFFCYRLKRSLKGYARTGFFH